MEAKRNTIKIVLKMEAVRYSETLESTLQDRKPRLTNKRLCRHRMSEIKHNSLRKIAREAETAPSSYHDCSSINTRLNHHSVTHIRRFYTSHQLCLLLTWGLASWQFSGAGVADRLFLSAGQQSHDRLRVRPSSVPPPPAAPDPGPPPRDTAPAVVMLTSFENFTMTIK